MAGRRRKVSKGRHTRPTVWDDAAELQVLRGGETLDPGVNYFVLMLNQMGLDTEFSCEGHPDGFYVTFSAPYNMALDIQKAGYFTVEIEGKNYWSIRRNMPSKDEEAERVDAMRWAAEAWEKRFGPLDLEAAVLDA